MACIIIQKINLETGTEVVVIEVGGNTQFLDTFLRHSKQIVMMILDIELNTTKRMVTSMF